MQSFHIIVPACRRKLSQAMTLSVGVAANGFPSTSAAGEAVTGFTNAIKDDSLRSALQRLASLSVTSVGYTQQPTITTSAVDAVPAPSNQAAKNSLPGILQALTANCLLLAGEEIANVRGYHTVCSCLTCIVKSPSATNRCPCPSAVQVIHQPCQSMSTSHHHETCAH